MSSPPSNAVALGYIEHPGTPAQTRYQAQLCHTQERSLTLEGGQTLHDAIVQALQKQAISSAYLTINNAAMQTLHYVIPGDDPSGQHAAWYSETHRLSPPANIHTAGIHVGLRDGEPFLHCHGIWQQGDGHTAVGHLLAPASILANDIEVSCIAIEGAYLAVTADEETRFPLFAPYQGASSAAKPNALLLTLRPNQDLNAAIAATAKRYGIDTAQIMGLGSLVQTCFTDGHQLKSHANEILILDGTLKDGQPSLQAVSVGIGGEQHQGALAPGRNAICVTCELLLRF
ncbi:MAG: hypothetical protein ACTIDT_08165 [Halomonas sp.]|uniref:hypothetical protein n=1 Tax=unclassified Halomonas TaxID=2609666 RepID=UPI003FB99F98